VIEAAHSPRVAPRFGASLQRSNGKYMIEGETTRVAWNSLVTKL
jgi:hypothetical protein